jgi:hypothetical protein
MVAQRASTLHSYVHYLSCYLLVTWIQSGTAVYSRCFLRGEVLFMPFGWHIYSGGRQCASAGIANIRMLEFSVYHAEPSPTWHTDIANRIEINHSGVCVCVCVYGGEGAGSSFQIQDITPIITWLRSCISQTLYVLFQISLKGNCREKATCIREKY